jgi:2-polyprenyl-3-methyl-5-hydroxy-6-metoxy-1,4-benzoquinol methylase
MPEPVGYGGMDDYLAANRALWDEWTAIHQSSSFYDLEGFKRGGSRLRDYEVDEVGDVTGKSLLHLQCHFGIDTLSWARLGARVTGADFSQRAIQLARSLAAELHLEATFVRADLYGLPAVLDGQFDVVYTSRGCWAGCRTWSAGREWWHTSCALVGSST